MLVIQIAAGIVLGFFVIRYFAYVVEITLYLAVAAVALGMLGLGVYGIWWLTQHLPLGAMAGTATLALMAFIIFGIGLGVVRETLMPWLAKRQALTETDDRVEFVGLVNDHTPNKRKSITLHPVDE